MNKFLDNNLIKASPQPVLFLDSCPPNFRPSPAFTNFRRNGGAFEDRLPAIEYLIGRGYIVLLTGDFILNRNIDAHVLEGNRKIVCADILPNMNRSKFSLFAETNADFSIGDTGGGNLIACVNKIPYLLINAFPIGFGMPNAWCFYKYLRKEDGTLLLPDKVLEQYSLDYICEQFQVCNNSPEEILEAVKLFVEIIFNEVQSDYVHEIMISLPQCVLAKYTNSNILPNWFKTN